MSCKLSMKRLRSYCDDLDSGGEKAICKDWGRRDQDSERSSSHRRFYSKVESGRKGLSSSSGYDRSVDDDREGSRSLRKRLDHDSDGFERRKSFDRYRDCSDRGVSISSPRSGYDRERIHRSESFSVSRREFPKGFRSERDRSRRDDSVSSWRRFGGSKDVDEEARSGVDSARGSRVALDDRGNVRSPQGLRDVVKSPPCSKDSSGEPSKSVEVKKNEVQADSASSSEMEEGELEPEAEAEAEADAEAAAEPEAKPESLPVTEPEPEPKHDSETQPSFGMDSKNQKEFGTEDQIVLDKKLEDEAKSSLQEDSELGKEGECDRNQEVAALEMVTDVKKIDELPDCDDKSSGELRGSREAVGADDGDTENGESLKENLQCLPSSEQKHDRQDEVGDEAKSAEKLLPLVEKQKEKEGIDLEAEAEDIDLADSNKEVVKENREPDVTMTLILNPNVRDKGKSPAISPSIEACSKKDGEWMEMDHLACGDDAMEGPSNRGFELFFTPSVTRTEKTNKSCLNKHKDEKLKLEPLELSLGLPNVQLPLASQDPIPAPVSGHARSAQSFPTAFRTSSDGFTASISFSGSQPFVHNPSCSLTQNSLDNYEQSVGSHPIFHGVDQVSQGSWQGQSSNDPKRKEVPLYQRILMNGNGSLHQSHASEGFLDGYTMQGEKHLKVSDGSPGILMGLDRQLSLQRQLSGVQQRHHDEVRSPTHSVGSRETKSELVKDKKRPMRENSGSLFRSSSQREMEQLLIGRNGFVEKVIAMIASEPIQVMSSRIHDMPEQVMAYLKECACEIIVNKDKHGQLRTFQETLHNRSDLTLETLLKSHRAQMEILVALKTGLRDFLLRIDNIPSLDLAEIFLNLKCRNLACRSLLPVDECDCKICLQKNGFCSSCMCLVCSKFDMASNTCSWVGCDVCLHWCHTDCGLRESYIRNGRSANGPDGKTEMQFHCFACDHPSEMFGFVKEVFKTCAKEWKAETLRKELEYVKRIFCASNDVRGKQLHMVADKMLVRLENKIHLPEVYNHIMEFLADSDSDSKVDNPSTFSKEIPINNQREGSNGLGGMGQQAMWLTSTSTEKAPPHVEHAVSSLPSFDWGRVGQHGGDSELQVNNVKKPVLDELDCIVKIKWAEAKMFQARADDARREAEGLKRIAVAKNKKIDEEYTSRITKLGLVEAEERRKQKLEEFQVQERDQREYFSMKMRMEGEIKDLLLKMEATRRNLGT